MARKKRPPLSAGALASIEGALFITATGYDRREIMREALRELERSDEMTWSAAQEHAWRVARGQMAKAQAA